MKGTLVQDIAAAQQLSARSRALLHDANVAWKANDAQTASLFKVAAGLRTDLHAVTQKLASSVLLLESGHDSEALEYAQKAALLFEQGQANPTGVLNACSKLVASCPGKAASGREYGPQ